MSDFEKPMQGETLGDYLECRLLAVNMALEAIQRQIDTITEAHNTVVGRLEKIAETQCSTFIEAHKHYHSFTSAMQAFTNGKQVKRLLWNKWYSVDRCDCIPVYADSIIANDWLIK